jgi:hypothetical protein
VRHLKSPVSPSNAIHNADDCGKDYEGSGTEIVNASPAARLEFDDVGAVILRPEDHDLVLAVTAVSFAHSSSSRFTAGAVAGVGDFTYSTIGTMFASMSLGPGWGQRTRKVGGVEASPALECRRRRGILRRARTQGRPSCPASAGAFFLGLLKKSPD